MGGKGDIDTDKIDEAFLAPLQLTLHDRNCALKGHDWDGPDACMSRTLFPCPLAPFC
jgi:hypothetical protein